MPHDLLLNALKDGQPISDPMQFVNTLCELQEKLCNSDKNYLQKVASSGACADDHQSVLNKAFDSIKRENVKNIWQLYAFYLLLEKKYTEESINHDKWRTVLGFQDAGVSHWECFKFRLWRQLHGKPESAYQNYTLHKEFVTRLSKAMSMARNLVTIFDEQLEEILDDMDRKEPSQEKKDLTEAYFLAFGIDPASQIATATYLEILKLFSLAGVSNNKLPEARQEMTHQFYSSNMPQQRAPLLNARSKVGLATGASLFAAAIYQAAVYFHPIDDTSSRHIP